MTEFCWIWRHVVSKKQIDVLDVRTASIIRAKWRQYAPLKRWSISTRLYVLISQKAVVLILSAVRT
jgi:hypothetical protein